MKVAAQERDFYMNAMPETSVVITCYNYGKYLDGCIASVLNQTYRDFEIIVVDDGSTDDTSELMKKYLGLPNLRYVRQLNGGQANAKNCGIRQAKGSYVAFLDADDLWESTKLALQIDLFRDPKVGVVYSLARYIDEAGGVVEAGPVGRYLRPRAGEVSGWLFLDNFIPFSSSVVRRECFERFGVFDETIKMGIDWDLWLRFSTGYSFAYVAEPLLAYRVGHPGQMSKNLEERQRCSDRIMAKFLNNHPGLLDKTTVKEAYSYTFCNRGNYFRRVDPKKSWKFFLSAIGQRPFNSMAYRGILKNIVGWLKL